VGVRGYLRVNCTQTLLVNFFICVVSILDVHDIYKRCRNADPYGRPYLCLVLILSCFKYIKILPEIFLS
jgi:hypothetical protein